MLTRKELFLACIFFLNINNIILPDDLHSKLEKEKWVLIPKGSPVLESKVKHYENTDYKAWLYCRDFRQGELIQGKILFHDKKSKIIKILFNDKELPFQKQKEHYYYFIPLHRKQALGENHVAVEYRTKKEVFKHLLGFKILKTKWKLSKELLDLGRFSEKKKVSNKHLKKISRFRKYKKDSFILRTKLLLNEFRSYPLNKHFVTSSFGVERSIERYQIKDGVKKKVSSVKKIHKGLDLRGNSTTSIYALANGKVVLSKKMYYEGIYTVINHGHGIFTGYMHQSKSFVKKFTKKVKAGERIGMVGSTGSTTGPHLHLLLKVRGVYLDPMSLLHLPLVQLD